MGQLKYKYASDDKVNTDYKYPTYQVVREKNIDFSPFNLPEIHYLRDLVLADKEKHNTPVKGETVVKDFTETILKTLDELENA